MSARLALHWAVTLLAAMAAIVASSALPNPWAQPLGSTLPVAVLACGYVTAPAIRKKPRP
ncbi:hypothetical protein [Streptomyces aureus]|uniref:hypothetical protein n=1 Tax=Streptomyces aureus TaxID=193461 RepID=UPI0005687327|nr:hypothetical protein [Streptomyces aureus]